MGGEATGPLAGVRVLDISSVLSGPLCAQILGDLGADVVKLEPRAGDTARYLGAEGQPGMSGIFVQANRNKRSVALDLKSDAGRDAFLALAASADVVVENFRPGVSDRLGIGFERARQRNPGLIWVAISGFGPEGPYAEQPAYDMVIQGMSGFAKMLGDEQNPKLIGNLVADKTSGMTACYSLLAALYAREKNGGRGQRLDIPMIDAFSSFLLCDGFAPQTYGGPPRDRNLEAALYRAWKTADGHVSLLAVEDRQFEALCKVIGHEELIEDERYRGIANRIANAAELFGLLESELLKWTTADLVERARRFGAPVAPVYDIAGFMQDAQVRANEIVLELEDSEHGTMKLFRSPPRYESTPTNVRRLPPRLGEHTHEVLREAGFDEEEIARITGATG
jgi:crotonobetainyl-CoA:carnitine CoA-transferase CaiB-like acyl-CoA transferase